MYRPNALLLIVATSVALAGCAGAPPAPVDQPGSGGTAIAPTVIAPTAIAPTAIESTAFAPTPVAVPATTAPETAASGQAVTAASVSPCADPAFREQGVAMAFIVASSPFAGESVRSGFAVSGCANVNEGALQWRLKASDGTPLADGLAQATCATGCVGDFAFNVEFTAPAAGPQSATIEVYSTSMRDG